MSSNIKELMEIVAEVNNQILNFAGESGLYLDMTVSSDGYATIVEFLGCVVYSSEDSSLRCDDDGVQESVKTYIIRETNHILQTLQGLKIWEYQ